MLSSVARWTAITCCVQLKFILNQAASHVISDMEPAAMMVMGRQMNLGESKRMCCEAS